MKSINSFSVDKNKWSEIDIAIGKNGIITTDELGKIRLRLENKLRLFYNEWFLHENNGIYWVKREFNNGQIGNTLEKFNIETQVREIILEDEDVKELETFESHFNNATGKYKFDIVIRLKNDTLLRL